MDIVFVLIHDPYRVPITYKILTPSLDIVSVLEDSWEIDHILYFLYNYSLCPR